MVRLTGYVEIAGRREPLNWVITDSGIVEGVGLSASGVIIHGNTPLVAETPPTAEPIEPTDYDSLNKTELQVLCSQRGLPVSGTKAELIARLNESDGDSNEGESEGESAEEGEDDGAESESE